MHQPTLEELEKAADDILSKAQESEELDPADIAEGAQAPEDDDESAEDEAGEDVKKSLLNEVIDDDPEATETMTALVEIFAKSLSGVMENVSNSQEFAENSSTILAKSLLAQNIILDEQKAGLQKANEQLSALSKSMLERLEAIESKLDQFGAQPAHMRKSVASYNVADRNFQNSLAGSDQPRTTLSKAQILGILNNELMSGSPIVTAQDIIAAESGGSMRQEIRALLDSKCAR